MKPFHFECGTKLVFGPDGEKKIGDELKAMGAEKVLFVYGGKSIKESGLYEKVLESLHTSQLEVTELPGVVQNPRVSLVREGIEICRKESVNFLLAVGGGSVIDTCKAISFGVYYENDVWDLISGKVKPGTKRIPVAVILTLPAAGSEESDSCVISDETLQIKTGFGSPLMRPVLSVMNPELTLTLPMYQTACGCTDMLAHAMERYFSPTKNVEMTDRMAEGIMTTIVNNFAKLIENPQDLNARAEIMLCGTFAQNDLTGMGRAQDWFNHGLEHQISGFYDIAHGAGLAISFPAWMKYLADKESCVMKLAQFAVQVFGVNMNFENPKETALEGVKRLRELLKKSGLPLSLSEVGIRRERFEEIADNMTVNGTQTCGAFYPMTRQDILNLLEMMA